MRDTPFMPLWVSDFVGDTLDLDAKEIGAYMLLLMTMWQRGGSLPADEKKLKRVARVGRDWPKIWGGIQHYFQVTDGQIFNKRLSQELQKVDAKRRVNAHSGARGGRAKALKYKETVMANATISPKQPEPESKKREGKPSLKKGTRLSQDWKLPREWGDWAMGEGWPETVIRFEAEKFRDYWVGLAGQKATKLDWPATWRNWMRRNGGPKVIHGGQYDKPTKQSERLNAFISGARGSS